MHTKMNEKSENILLHNIYYEYLSNLFLKFDFKKGILLPGVGKSSDYKAE